MTDTVLEHNLDDVEEIRNHPTGWYRGTVVGYKVGVIPNEDQKQYADIEFRADAALSDQDLTGVELNRIVRGRVMLTAESAKYAKKQLREFGIDLTGLSYKDALEAAVGKDVDFYVEPDAYAAKRGRDIVKVSRWKPTE